MMKLLKNLLVILTSIAFAILIYFGVKNKWYNYIINPGCNHQIAIDELNSELNKKQQKIDELNKLLSQKETAISALNIQIEQLKGSINSKENSINELKAQIRKLNLAIENYENSTKIAELNNKIDELNSQIQSLNSTINSLTTEKNQMQETIDYYENYINSIESETDVFATYEFAGKIYQIQQVTKNSSPAVIENPTSTAYVIFNYWELNGQRVNPSEVVLTSNTKFIANVTYKFDVNFVSKNEAISTSIVTKNDYATEPTNPTKAHHTFLGWSLNKVDVISVSETPIVKNTTFYAVFEIEQLSVKFMNENNLITTKSVDYGSTFDEISNSVIAPDIEDFKFIGWKKQNGELMNSNSVIESNLELTAVYEQVIFNIEFIDNSISLGKFKTIDNKLNYIPEALGKDGLKFKCWIDETGNELNISSDTIFNKDMKLTAKYNGTLSITNFAKLVLGGADYRSENFKSKYDFITIEKTTRTDKSFGGVDAQTTPALVVTFNFIGGLRHQLAFVEENNQWKLSAIESNNYKGSEALINSSNLQFNYSINNRNYRITIKDYINSLTYLLNNQSDVNELTTKKDNLPTISQAILNFNNNIIIEEKIDEAYAIVEFDKLQLNCNIISKNSPAKSDFDYLYKNCAIGG